MSAAFRYIFTLRMTLFLLLWGVACLIASASATEAIVQRLVDDGYENVRVQRLRTNYVRVAIEDHHYRGIYTGLAQAFRLVQPESSDTVELIALRQRIPVLTLRACKLPDGWVVYDSQYGGTLGREMSSQPVLNSSYGHVDVIAFPEISYSNTWNDHFWSVVLWLSPAIEATLWPGAKATVQGRFLVYKYFAGDYDRFSLGYISLEQQLVSTRHFDVSAAAGVFSCYRNGIEFRAHWHPIRTLQLGILVGDTGPWYMDGLKPVFCKWDKLNFLAHLNYYEPYSRIQLDVKAGKFLYGYNGIRADAWRHYHDRAVGIYCESSEYSTNIGFQFSVTMGSRKMGKRRAVRVRLPQTIQLNYGETIKGHKDYNLRGTPHFRTSPNEGVSADYWQPEMIRRYVQEALNLQ